MKLLKRLAVIALAVSAWTADAAARDLRVNINADPEMIDPITYSALIAGDVLRNVYQGFTDVGRSGAIEPALATKWTAHPDNLGWRFELRKGVKFHSGRDFTAADVKASFERLLAPGSKAGLALQYLQRIEGAKAVADGQSKDLAGVKIVDDHTLDVRFTAPDVLFPIYPFMIFDAKVIDEKGPEWFLQVSAGTGPFSFTHWKRGQEVKLAAHKAYWGGAPRIDGVHYVIVPSEDTAVSMYEAGELDLLNVAGTDLARRIMRDAKLKAQAITAPAAQINFLGMNQNLFAPFKDRRVREALCLAIDRDAMTRGLFGGLAEPLAGQVTPGIPGANPELKALKFDAERAKRLMAEAGFPDGRNMPALKIAALAPFRNENAYYVDQWKKVLGLTVEIEIMERATFLRALNAGEVPLFAWGWTAGYPDALYFLSQVWHSKSPYNRARYANAEFDRLIDQAQVTPDDAARYKLYNQAEKALLDDFGTCGLFVRTQVALVKPNVKGVTLTPMRYLPYGGVTIE
ncbi:MAG: ABC transporter substrate-binding protein [Alphaproteobacteria bacterium]|nr:ABC transporter substrate-binding protein [Alphaproteobacteria bacterium]